MSENWRARTRETESAHNLNLFRSKDSNSSYERLFDRW
jgi:hypothetical protein